MLCALSLSALILFPQDPDPVTPSRQEEPRLWPTKRVEQGDMVTLFYRTGHLSNDPPPKGPGPGKWYSPIVEKFLDTAKGEWIIEAEHLHTVTIRVHKDNEKLITDIVQSLDVPKPQVYLEAKVVQVAWTKDQELGFEGGLANFVIFQAVNPDALLRSIGANFRPTSLGATANPDTFRGGSFRFGALPSNRQGTYDGFLRAFVERGQARVQAQPKLIVNSGAEAEFKSVDRVPIPTGRLTVAGATQDFNFEDVGTVVKLHPHVVADNQIDLEITVELSTISRFEQFPVAGDVVSVPVITRRTSKSSLTVENDTEVVISGILLRTNQEVTRGLPYVSDIPVLGAFFRSSDEEASISELVIIIRPKIYYFTQSKPALIDPFKDD